jgi:hypothetical protein
MRRLSDQQLAQVEQALLEGVGANGFVGELWTLERVATVIECLTGVRHHPAWCGRCCATGWTGACSGPGAGRPSATRMPSTAGSTSAGDQANCECVGLWFGRIAVRLRRRHRGMTPKQTGTEVAFGRAVCRGAGVDLGHRLLA